MMRENTLSVESHVKKKIDYATKLFLAMFYHSKM